MIPMINVDCDSDQLYIIYIIAIKLSCSGHTCLGIARNPTAKQCNNQYSKNLRPNTHMHTQNKIENKTPKPHKESDNRQQAGNGQDSRPTA